MTAVPRGRLVAVVIAVGVAALFAARGPALFPDSTGYLDHSPMRPAGYPLFLDLCRLAGGQRLRVAVFLQTLAAVLAIACFVRRLGARLGFGFTVCALAIAILVSGPVVFAGAIATESLTFACFLYTMSHAVDALCVAGVSERERHLLHCAGGIALATLLRSQFIFLWPLFALGLIVHFAARRGPGALRLPVWLALVLVAQWSVQHGYCYVRNGRLSGSGLTGLQVATVGLYLADCGDGPALADSDATAPAGAIVKGLCERRLTAATRANGLPPAMYYSFIYNDIAWGTIAPAFHMQEDSAVPVEAWKALDRATLHIGLSAIRLHPARYVRFVLSLMWFQYRFFVCLAAGVALVALLRLGRDRGDSVGRIGLLFGLAWLANLTLVCMVELPIGRYTFYTDGLLVVFVLGLFATMTAGGAGARAGG